MMYIHFPILDNREYDNVRYYLVFNNKEAGYNFIYAESNELFTQDVIRQGIKIAEENNLGQPSIVEIHEKREILKELPIE